MSLEKLFTKTRIEVYNGVEISINDVTLREAPIVAKLIGEVSGKENSDIAKIISENMKEVKDLICSLTNIPKESIDKISIDAIIFVIAKIIKHNISYLKKTVLPMAKEIEDQMKVDGSKQSKN